jgi:hypothetical protein
MRRLFLICLLTVLSVGGAVKQRVFADVTILDHYRLLPRESTLHQTGGFAGLDLTYRLLGDYGFAHATGSVNSAQFVDPEIWGSLIPDGPTPAHVIDVDQILNLAELHGKLLPTASLFDVYQFQGKTSDGSSVNLYASLLGPWMYLRGATQPPAGSADYFEYQLRALAHKGPFADVNGDDAVDASDYLLLRKMAAAGGADAASGASIVDWRSQFGETMPDLNAMDAAISAAAGSRLAASSVPEPTGWLLVMIASALVSLWRRRC